MQPDWKKGIHRVRKRLADGRVVEYHYAWRGGPQLKGEPDSEEYVRSLLAARESRKEPSRDLFQSIVTGYRQSKAYGNLRPRKDRTFHDNRGTAATRLSEAGCTPQEIAAITGHMLRSVTAILEKYLARTDKLAIAAIAKLEGAARERERNGKL